MRKVFWAGALVVMVTIGVSAGWPVFGEIQTSEAARFEESIDL